MTSDLKTDQLEITSTLWELETKLGIPIWHNSLSLPKAEHLYTTAEINLQEKQNFIFIRDIHDTSRISIFVSEQTDFIQLFQNIPFLTDHFRCFLCNDPLIKERLSILEKNQSINSDNTASRRLVNLLKTAVDMGASDIHLENQANKKIVRMRINGELTKINLDDEINEAVFIKIKLISQMDIAKSRTPQDGHFPYTTEKGQRYDMRTSTIPGIFGEKIVIRLLPASTVRFSMAELGFSNDHIVSIRKQIANHSGMILFTGPTGSGKTTSLYAILNELINEPINIVTIEDPVEYRIKGITQVQVNEQAGVTFSGMLRACLRQDPDVILIGEIRDQETAQIAARSAQTGHLVLSTVHSNDGFETIRRLQNLGVENDDIASSLKMVISQRLVRKLCECDSNPDCNICGGTGTIGRMPLMEILKISPKLRSLISTGSPLDTIRKYAEANNHATLKSNAMPLIQQGVISVSEFESVLDYDL